MVLLAFSTLSFHSAIYILFVATCLSYYWILYFTSKNPTFNLHYLPNPSTLPTMSTTPIVESEEVQLLTGRDDLYSGVTVDRKLLAKTPALFERQLEQSLLAWRQAKRRGIWLSIPHDRTELLPTAQKLGFVLHHAVPEYIMLTHWLDESDPNQLPSYAMSSVGVGGFVVNKKREVLVIQERFAHAKDYFKLPGGCLDKGESIERGVEREVFEETGIRAHFRGILGFTYKDIFRFDHGDIYFGCLMSLDENEEEQQINFDPLEIAACKWTPLDEYANSPETHPVLVTLQLARSAVAVLDGREQLLEPELISVKSSNPTRPPWNVMMYRNKSIDKE